MKRLLLLLFTLGGFGFLTAQPTSQTYTGSAATTSSDAVSETYTFTIPDDWQADICVTAWGAGGGGGKTGLNGAETKFPPGGGAGGGAYIEQCFTAVPCGDYTIEVGVGGGYNFHGGDSSFDFDGTKYDARGGRKGGSTAASGGLGGVASGGTVAVNGGLGGTRSGGGQTHAGGGGGGSGPTPGAGGAASACVGGIAGTGAGAGGAGGVCNGDDQSNTVYSTLCTGDDGVFPGGGGGGRGGAWAVAMPEQFPGLGASGQVIVTVSNPVMVACDPLPVELIEFKVSNAEYTNTLAWATASEENNNFFEVQRSYEGGHFESISIVKSKEVSTTIRQDYSEIDIVDKAGTYYYRLKQVDLDGTFTFTETRAVKVKGKDIGFSLFPNPASKVLQLRFNEVNKGNDLTDIRIYNANGLLVKTKPVAIAQHSVHSIELDELTKGVYFIELEMNYERLYKKFVIVD